jgi:hypothetical protein
MTMQPADAVAAVAPVAAALESLGVSYYLGGSIASSAFGIARATLDVDLVADLEPRHVGPLLQLLQSDYYVSEKAASDAVAKKSCFNVIHLETMFKVDVFCVKERPYDRQTLARVRKATIDPHAASPELCLASAEDVVLSKLEWFRLGEEVSERQWRDVLGVLAVQRGVLDDAYLDKWAVQLGISDLLERARKEAIP